MSGGGGGAAADSGPRKNAFGESELAGVELNLTALMDILSNLLFFLLASFGATVVMSINTQVPTQSSEGSSVADTGESVTLNVHLDRAALTVSAAGGKQDAAELDAMGKKIPHVDGKVDAKTLADHLYDIKQKYPKSDTIILTPDTGVKYEMMIQVMDAARERRVTVSGQAHSVAMFPTVVVSTLVK